MGAEPVREKKGRKGQLLKHLGGQSKKKTPKWEKKSDT